MKEKKEPTSPLSLRVSKELHERLKTCAEKLRQKPHSLAQAAVEAAVEAIEKNGYRIVLPIQFDVTHVAAQRDENQPLGKLSSSHSPAPAPHPEAVGQLNEPTRKAKPKKAA